jgi:KTSC domain
MTRSPVKSSNLKSVGYDPKTQTMEIEFLNGNVFRYDGVPAHHHAGLLKHSSPGTYFHTHIKGAFDGEKVG